MNKSDNYVGCSSATNKMDYDIVFGFLFQSEVGSKFTPIQNEIKGMGFNPQLQLYNNEVIFNTPSYSYDKNAKKDSLRLVFIN